MLTGRDETFQNILDPNFDFSVISQNIFHIPFFNNIQCFSGRADSKELCTGEVGLAEQYPQLR